MQSYYNMMFHEQTDNYDFEDRGRVFTYSGDQVWFPIAGQLSTVNNFYYTEYGFYWSTTSSPMGLTQWFDAFYFKQDYIDYDGAFEPGVAQSVRCIKYDVATDSEIELTGSYSVQLSSSTDAYGWQLSSTVSNPNSSEYDGVYESTNKNINNSQAFMYVNITGYDTFKIYVRSYAESNYDYVVVSNPDCQLTSSTTTTSSPNVKMTTYGQSSSNTSISGYTLVEFTNLGKSDHKITIMYRKDTSQHNYDDKGYVLIPKQQ